MADERMEVDCSDSEMPVAGTSSMCVNENTLQQPVTANDDPISSKLKAVFDDSEWDEIVEESLIQVAMDNPDDLSNVNTISNVRMIGIDTDSPALQIENTIYRLNEWRYIQGTAMFFEQTKEVKKIDPLFENRCGSVFQYVGSTRKCLEVTKKETIQ